MSMIANEALELLDKMDLLFREAKQEYERRSELRLPFFRPIKIERDDPDSEPIMAFSRDLSPMGIGLIHPVPIETGQVTITVSLGNGRPVRLRIEIRWCWPNGDDWHMSGAKVLAVVHNDWNSGGAATYDRHTRSTGECIGIQPR